MAKNQKPKVDKVKLALYLAMMGETAKGLDPDKLDFDKSMNLINTSTGAIEFRFDTFPEKVQAKIVPPVVDDETEFESANESESENENEFEATSDRPVMVKFWDYKNEKRKVGIWLGEGREVGGFPTWLFFEPATGEYFITPQWKWLEYFETANNVPQYKFELIYREYVEPKAGKKGYHTGTLNKSKKPVEIPHTADISKLVEPIS